MLAEDFLLYGVSPDGRPRELAGEREAHQLLDELVFGVGVGPHRTRRTAFVGAFVAVSVWAYGLTGRVVVLWHFFLFLLLQQLVLLLVLFCLLFLRGKKELVSNRRHLASK